MSARDGDDAVAEAAEGTAEPLAEALTAVITFESGKNRDQFMRAVTLMSISGQLVPKANEAHLVLAAVYESLRTGDPTIVKEH